MRRVPVRHRGVFALLLIFAGSIPGGCVFDAATEPGPPREYHDRFFPMALGNRWTYADTLFLYGTHSTDTVASLFALEILSYRRDGSGDVWWTFSTGGGFLTPVEIRRDTFELMQRDDTVFQVMSRADTPTIAFLRPEGLAASFNVPQDSGFVFVGVNAAGPQDAAAPLVQNFLFNPTPEIQSYCDQTLLPGVGITGWSEVLRTSPEAEPSGRRKVSLIKSALKH